MKILYRQLEPFSSPPFMATFHYGAILTALGLSRLGRNIVQKVEKSGGYTPNANNLICGLQPIMWGALLSRADLTEYNDK